MSVYFHFTGARALGPGRALWALCARRRPPGTPAAPAWRRGVQKQAADQGEDAQAFAVGPGGRAGGAAVPGPRARPRNLPGGEAAGQARYARPPPPPAGWHSAVCSWRKSVDARAKKTRNKLCLKGKKSRCVFEGM